MTFRIPLMLPLSIACLAISACSSSDSGSSNSGGGGGLIGQPQALDRIPDDSPEIPTEAASPEIAAIAGLWNNSVAEGTGGEIDVFYLEITPDGDWNNFDYRGDNVDLGENCYVLGSGQISSLGGSNYRVTVPAGILELSAVVANGRLEITGNIGTVTLPAVVGLSSTDFNLC